MMCHDVLVTMHHGGVSQEMSDLRVQRDVIIVMMIRCDAIMTEHHGGVSEGMSDLRVQLKMSLL